MIELVSTARCTGCNICVHVCPTNVFDANPRGIPSIARQGDCQTCFMCEAYCPEDALFVAAQSESTVAVEEEQLARTALLGSYRREIGWSPGLASRAGSDHTFHLMDLIK